MTEPGEVLSAGGITSVRVQPEPVVHADGRVTFRLEAPDARSVLVVPMGGDNGMGEGPYEMAVDEAGAWTVTIGPVEPGFHYYLLNVDGFQCLNPYAEPYWGWGRVTMGLDVPEPGVDFYYPRDVPHGELRLHYWRSELTDSLRRAVVYTPPGYDADAEARYPVLYLQHGAGEGERCWTWQGKANFILDNLLADGQAVPMMIVMENGYAALPGEPDPGKPSREANVFGKLVVEELIPHVDGAYRTLPDREHRAIAGLSMGAGQAMRIGLSHLDTFAHVACLSGGAFGLDPETPLGAVLNDAGAINSKLKLLWLGSGRRDRAWERLKAMHERFEETGVRHVWFDCEGAHEWQSWRKQLHDLAPRLFRP